MEQMFILVVDANEDRRQRYKELFSKSGYIVLSASKGTQALEIFRINAFEIRVVLVSDSIQEMSCVTFVQHLKKDSILPEVLVLSDHLDIPDVVDLMKSGTYEVIKTPLPDDAVLLAVKNAIECTDILTKMDNYARHSQEIDIHTRLEIYQNLQQKRRLQGKPVTIEELMMLFPSPSQRESISLNSVIKELELNSKITTVPTLLIVEDEDELRGALHRMLKPEYQIFLAASGQEAIALLTQEKQIDLVLLDIGLPDISGDTLISKIREIHKEADIIMLTAYNDFRTASNAMRSGASDFITKPFDDLILQVKLAGVLQKKYLRQLAPMYLQDRIKP